jgi:hypothetical protein
VADDALVLDAIAEALEAAAAVLRRHAAAPEPAATVAEPGAASAAERARLAHPMLGFRQIEIIRLLEAAGTKGTTTGAISSTLRYDQPNVYLTLKNLIVLGFAEKDSKASPHRYFLGPALRQEDAA